jgi:hypothetical protein
MKRALTAGLLHRGEEDGILPRMAFYDALTLAPAG